MLIYNLPFLITLTALNNAFIKTWFLWEVIMVYILIMFVPQWLIFFIDLLIGTISALFCYKLFYGGGVIFEPVINPTASPLDIVLYLSTFAFAIISGLIFSYSNAKGVAFEERAKIFKSLAASIAHELRNPLNAINLIGSQINDLAPKFDKQNGDEHSTNYDEQNSKISDLTLSTSPKLKLLKLTSHISDSISNANNIINIILSDLSGKTIDSDDLIYLKPNKILPEILEKYSYKNDEEKTKVKLLLPKYEEDNFTIRAVPDRLTYIVYNLLKNSLYYLNEYPDSIVTVGSETRNIDGIEYNIIYVHDTGPGIAGHAIPRLFDDFYTSGKKEGTGLGLSFCKRNMQMFGGDIICESEFGKWTRFSLLFPKLTDEEMARVITKDKKKKILLVDDQKVNLITKKSKIEKVLPDLLCDTANNGKDAIKMAKENKYQLILMDIEMPEINGIEAAKKIRSYNKETLIIAFTSLSKKSFLEEVKKISDTKNFNFYLSKSVPDNALFRCLTKWIIDIEDDLSYLGTKEEILEILRGKKIILADDQKLNRMITKNILEKSGLLVTEATDGKELLEIYKNSLDENAISSFDVILTDVNMHPYDGDEAAKEIRKIENQNNVSQHDEIPIIAISGDGEKENIYHFFDCQMTDYFIKGNNPELLIKIIANYAVKRDLKIHELAIAQVKEDKDLADSCLTNIKIFDQKNIEHFEQKDQAEILELFLKDSSNLMLKIRESFQKNNRKEILFLIHSMKGISSNIGATRLANYVGVLKSVLKNDTQPKNWLKNLEALYLELEKEIEQTIKQKNLD
ncbi:MAG: response regulator [Rickettsiales bacterium]|nr:response regulator [Rickettsiales bacterium]